MHMTPLLKRQRLWSCLHHAARQLQHVSKVLFQSLQWNGKVIEKTKNKYLPVEGCEEKEN